MVYWGCGTERNRAAWAYVVVMATTGAALFVLGAAKFDACGRLHAEPHPRGGDCGTPPRGMMIAGAAMIVAALPPLLFFSGCAAPPADDNDVGQDGRAAITVVRRAADGASALHYHYDAAGRLVMAPDRFTEQAAAVVSTAAKVSLHPHAADEGGPQPRFACEEGPLRASYGSRGAAGIIPAVSPSSSLACSGLYGGGGGGDVAGGGGNHGSPCHLDARAHHMTSLSAQFQQPHAAAADGGLINGFDNPSFPAAASPNALASPCAAGLHVGASRGTGACAPSFA